MDAPLKLTAFQKNLRALLFKEEPNARHHAAHLALRINRKRETAWSYLAKGTDSISAAKGVADAFDTTVSSLLDDTHDGLTRIDNACLKIGGRHAIWLTAWVEPDPSIPCSEDDLVVRLVEGVYWVEVFGDGPREPVHLVRGIEGVGEITPRSHCDVLVCDASGLVGGKVADLLIRHHFSVALQSHAPSPPAFSPDVIIVHGYDMEGASSIRREKNQLAPLVMLVETPPSHDPLNRVFFTIPDDFAALMMLREIVKFSPHAAKKLSNLSPSHL